MHHHHPHHCSPPLCEPLCQLPCHPHSRGTGRGLLQSRQRAQGEIEVLCQNHKNPAADTTSFTNVDEFVESVLAVLYAPDPEGEEHNSSLHTIHKLDQLCANTDVGEGIVVEFLNRRNSCLRATSKLDSKFPNLHPICSQLVALIVKSCLSIRGKVITIYYQQSATGRHSQ
ncbi:hypothetical protein Pelo_1763 [Pelomyxa schiedti]|nr:hypothetical protein Pelo_1763 [Pelomyxa schiedti]